MSADEATTMARIAALLGSEPSVWRAARLSERELSNRCWRVTLADGRRLFAKLATTALTAGWLRTEYAVYAALQAPYMPQVLGWQDGEQPLLLLEDLSDGFWPPPWSDAAVAAVRRTLAEVAATPPPAGLPRAEAMRPALSGWTRVADDPAPFLGLGLCSADWLAHALPHLLAAGDAAVLDGDSLLHFDVRSDNLCLRGERALLVDWSWAAVGHPLVDLAGWAPSLHAEGGPLPETLVPDGGALAALLSGYWASQAGLPPIPGAPHVRRLQRIQLEEALAWAVRALDLPPPTPSV